MACMFSELGKYTPYALAFLGILLAMNVIIFLRKKFR